MIAHLIKKTLYVGFFAFLIGNFNGLAKIVFDSFAGLGLKAAGSGLSADQLLQPGRIAQIGIDAGKPILQAASQLMGYVSFFENFVQIFVLLVAWLVVLVAFFILAVQLFVTLIEFKLTTLAGFVLVPFGLFNKTAFLAERVLGNVVASGVKVLVLAVIIGIGTNLFGEFTQGFGGNQPTLEDALALVLALASSGLASQQGLPLGRRSLAPARWSGLPWRRVVSVSLAPWGFGPGQGRLPVRAVGFRRSRPERLSHRLPRGARPLAPGVRRLGLAACVASKPSAMASPLPPTRSVPVITAAVRPRRSQGGPLMLFRRASVRYGRTPEPETPFQKAAQVWTSASVQPVSRRATGGSSRSATCFWPRSLPAA